MSVVAAIPCETCLKVINCGNIAPVDLYSLQSESFPFVAFCPAGFVCTGTSQLRLICCNREFAAVYPEGASDSDRLAITTDLINRCSAALDFCGQLPLPVGQLNLGGVTNPTPPIRLPTSFFYNTPQTCTAFCPDGNLFSYTLPAGIVLALSQGSADLIAHQYACAQAIARKLCLSVINPDACLGTAYSSRIIASGAFLAAPPATNFWVLVSGSLPPGLTVTLGNVTGYFVTIAGTPTTAGIYTFVIQIVAPNGESMTKSFTITVRGLTDSSPLPDATVNANYAFLLGDANMVGDVTWVITAGALPTGLTLDPETGEITGLPTVAGVFVFTVSITDSAL